MIGKGRIGTIQIGSTGTSGDKVADAGIGTATIVANQPSIRTVSDVYLPYSVPVSNPNRKQWNGRKWVPTKTPTWAKKRVWDGEKWVP